MDLYKQTTRNGGAAKKQDTRRYSRPRLTRANPNVAAAIAADEVAKAQASRLWPALPEINGIGQVTANKQSAIVASVRRGSRIITATTSLGRRSPYEIDIWGRVRDLAKAADATAEASAAALADAS